jgi:hypothetical protein
MAILNFGNFITKEGLVNLKNYKYRSGVYTPIDNAMQPFWNWFVTLVPMVNKLFFLIVVAGAKSYYSPSTFGNFLSCLSDRLVGRKPNNRGLTSGLTLYSCCCLFVLDFRRY